MQPLSLDVQGSETYCSQILWTVNRTINRNNIATDGLVGLSTTWSHHFAIPESGNLTRISCGGSIRREGCWLARMVYSSPFSTEERETSPQTHPNIRHCLLSTPFLHLTSPLTAWTVPSTNDVILHCPLPAHPVRYIFEKIPTTLVAWPALVR